MTTRTRIAAMATVAAAVALTASPVPAPTKVMDRKFPLGQFCPLESRGASAMDTLEFQAMGTAARITFTVNNTTGECDGLGGKPCADDCDCNTAPCDPNDPGLSHTCQKFCSVSRDGFGCATDADCGGTLGVCGQWNRLLLDNVTVVLRDNVFTDHMTGPIPGYDGVGGCYITSPPYDGTTGGQNDAPAFDFNAGGTPEIYLNLFDSAGALSGWSGQAYFDPNSLSAPRVPGALDVGSLDRTGGSLSVGRISDGGFPSLDTPVPVSASVVVSGLTSGQWYVVFAWWSITLPDQVSLTVDANVCPDVDGDGFAVCTGGCNATGLTCGDCDDTLSHCASTCADGDSDGWCSDTDCDDALPTCGADCVADLDADAVADCLDGCIDADGDLHGLPGGAGDTCLGGDCDETRAGVYAGAPQLCDGLNNDCSDPSYPVAPAVEADADADGHRICAGDCRDDDPSVNPGAPDIVCNGIDDDCSGQVDETFAGSCLCAQRGTGLAGWYQAEGNAANQTGSNNGILMGSAAFGTGLVGQAFSFDGAGYVELPDAPVFELPSQLTLEAWIRPDDVSTHRQIISKFGSAGSYAYQIGLAPLGGLRADLSANGTTYYVIASPSGVVSTSAWSHVAMTFNAGDWRLYVNGILVASQTAPISTVFAAGITKPSVGRDPAGIQHFVGRIDEAAIHSRALSAAEIQVIHAAGASGMCPCRDADRDGYGTQAGVLCYAGTQQDCGDTSATRYPGAPELCNGIDDDCDTVFDNGLSQTTFYRDSDNDGYGTTATTVVACAPPSGYVADGADCDDRYSWVRPGGDDANCDLWDQDCSGAADEDFASPPDGWFATSLNQVGPGRHGMTMVSTGNSVIVWGGATNSSSWSSLGGIYRPRTGIIDFWTPTSMGTNLPSARVLHSAVWTGSKMIIWGGSGASGFTFSGGLYDPATDSWTPTSIGMNVPSARAGHTAVWTGSRMIIWGGGTGSPTNTGGVYDPATNTWTPTSIAANVPSARVGHTAVWTGSRMIIWGGSTAGGRTSSGASYDPATNTWTPIVPGPLGARESHTAVWTGTQMLVWGGVNGPTFYPDGAIFDGALGQWVSTFSGLPVISARSGHTAVWDPAGGRMVVWGGSAGGGTVFNNGAGYDPVANTWTPLPAAGAPAPRAGHAAVWLPATSEMLVWGGNFLNTGGRIVPSPFTCGAGSCLRASGYTCPAGLAYGCTPGEPAPESCNLIDDDCDGTADNGIPAPTDVPLLSLASPGGAADLSWPAASGATGYDVVVGDLATLSGSGGDFTFSTAACLGNDLLATMLQDPTVPLEGGGLWYLVRAVNSCGGNGSYDETDPGQQGARDAEIAGSVAACP